MTLFVAPDDLSTVLLLVGLDPPKLLGGEQALHGLPHKHELEVVF
jgi:hypothetical protein